MSDQPGFIELVRILQDRHLAANHRATAAAAEMDAGGSGNEAEEVRDQAGRSRRRQDEGEAQEVDAVRGIQAADAQAGPSRGHQDEEADVAARCQICIEAKSSLAFYSTRCGHIFCQTCLMTAIRVRMDCPMCRRDLRGQGSFHRIFFN